MTSEEIAKKLSQYSYKEMGNSNLLYYSYENYWEKNKNYFVVQAEIYLRVKKCLQTKKRDRCVSPSEYFALRHPGPYDEIAAKRSDCTFEIQQQ